MKQILKGNHYMATLNGIRGDVWTTALVLLKIFLIGLQFEIITIVTLLMSLYIELSKKIEKNNFQLFDNMLSTLRTVSCICHTTSLPHIYNLNYTLTLCKTKQTNYLFLTFSNEIHIKSGFEPISTI